MPLATEVVVGTPPGTTFVRSPREDWALTESVVPYSTASPVTLAAGTATPPSLWSRPWIVVPAPEMLTASGRPPVAQIPAVRGTGRTVRACDRPVAASVTTSGTSNGPRGRDRSGTSTSTHPFSSIGSRITDWPAYVTSAGSNVVGGRVNPQT